MYHLVIVFGGQLFEPNINISAVISETKGFIQQEQFPGMKFALSLVEQLETRYRTLTRNMNSIQYPVTTGAVARKSSIGRTQVPGASKTQPKPGSGSAQRTRRGLFNFVGTIGKSLFGVATESDIKQLQDAVNNNRDSLSVISHQHNEMLIIVNATRFQVLENHQTINDLINTTNALREWVAETNYRQSLHRVVMFRIDMIENVIRQLERSYDKILRMRKDLEHGVLSEELLPLGELKSLITSALIPKDSNFVSPLYWYYTHMHVKMLQMGNELVYSVDLPLVSKQTSVAKQFQSYPTPNLISNITLQIVVQNGDIFTSHTGKALKLRENCMGHNPMVCSPMPVQRDGTDHSCASALLRLTNREVSQVCPVQVTRDTFDKLFYHDVDSFVLVTWGTEVMEGCLQSKVMYLKAGTYLINWSGDCPLCTRQHCIPGIVRAGSSLRLKNTWQALEIPKLQNFSAINIPVDPLKKTAAFEVETLDDLLMPEVPSIHWSKEHTSILVDIILFILFACVCVILGLMCFVYVKSNRRKPEVKISEELEQAMPLRELNKADTERPGPSTTNVLTPEQAAAILLSTPQAP